MPNLKTFAGSVTLAKNDRSGQNAILMLGQMVGQDLIWPVFEMLDHEMIVLVIRNEGSIRRVHFSFLLLGLENVVDRLGHIFLYSLVRIFRLPQENRVSLCEESSNLLAWAILRILICSRSSFL